MLESENPTFSHDCASREALATLVRLWQFMVRKSIPSRVQQGKVMRAFLRAVALYLVWLQSSEVIAVSVYRIWYLAETASLHHTYQLSNRRGKSNLIPFILSEEVQCIAQVQGKHVSITFDVELIW